MRLPRLLLATTLSTILFICVWIVIMWSYINYRKNRPELHAQSTFKLPGGVVYMLGSDCIFFLATIYFLALDETTLESLKSQPNLVCYFGNWLFLCDKKK